MNRSACRRRSVILHLMPLALILSACSGNAPSPSASDSAEIASRAACPRPMAYPRPVIYDTVYAAAPDMPVRFEVNVQATLLAPAVSGSAPAGTRWLNVGYPDYGATLFCTFTPVSSDADRSKVVGNRMERMMMNLGDNYATQTEVASPDGGYSSVIISSLGQTLTPVQFVSQGRQWVISGALQFNTPADAPIRPDSVKPYIDAVTADLIHAARILK